MKIKSRNLLTVILAVLCAVAVAISVGFALPKAEKITADAATTTATIKIKDVQPYSWQTTTTSGGNSVHYNNMNPGTGSITGAGSVVSNDTSISFSQSPANKYGKIIYIEFKVSVTVPAWEEWKISYTVNFYFHFTASDSYNMSMAAYYFLPDTSDPD